MYTLLAVCALTQMHLPRPLFLVEVLTSRSCLPVPTKPAHLPLAPLISKQIVLALFQALEWVADVLVWW